MEIRKNSLTALKICRFCLGQDEMLSSLYDRNKNPNIDIPLPLKILSCLSVEVFPSDKMPTFICHRCKFFIELFHNYKEVCRKADERIMHYVRNGQTLESMNWPSSLSKIYRLGLKSKPNVMKTVTEDGATVQVTSQDGTDSEEEEEEDDENVFNIKIGGGSQDGEKRIKVITSKSEDKESKKSAKEVLSYEADLDEEEQAPVDEGVSGVSGGPGASREKVWPCDQCDCTYPLQQLLVLHKKQKHRARNMQCDQCHAKFFTKFDLMAHQVRHTDEMPFHCVACFRKFKRLVLLKRHEKQMHSDIPQLACSSCPATFISLVELEAHQRRHARHSLRNHSCALCNKRFLHKTTLRRHMEVVHTKKPAFSCEYCPAQFSSVSNLTRHLRTHAGERLFPCKFCDKSFLRSHHYTRHLRLVHRGEVRGKRAEFRCEQCEESFESQDELIYHSAIHATQNLTCPLCQEKFEDVDAVTAHIKSHVNGTEFMCDLCELVFTSKEKLDSHLTSTHAEELDHDESMEDMDAEEDEDDNGINVKDEGDHMVVEIKKTDGFMLPEAQSNQEEKPDNTNSEESEAEPTYAEMSTVEPPAVPEADVAKAEQEKTLGGGATISKVSPKPAETVDNSQDSKTASILRKAEEVKRKVQQITSEPTEKKEKVAKVESSNVGASDKSLRLLEKELQELKRTNTRNEVSKTPVRTMESLRNRRPQLHTSTPKTRAESEKKMLASMKSPAIEKKVPERRALTQVKENKEPKEVKETKNSTPAKEEREKEKKEEVKEKETPKSVVKNGTAEKSTSEETVRRSTRPSKIKDYAKMIRDKSQDSNEESDDAEDDEYKEGEKEPRTKTRRSSTKGVTNKPGASPAAAPAAAPTRKRGRPRKHPAADAVPSKMKKDDPEEEEEKDSEMDKSEAEVSKPAEPAAEKNKTETAESAPAGGDANLSPSSDQKTTPSGGVLMSPTGQTLKKVPIRALPPGIKPLPLPVNARPTMGTTGELCEMQIGKKVVKVQKIVMTKAEVEAMAKKGLVEMKDGTMVLKQGIKIPTSDALSLKSTLVGDKEAAKESPSKTEKPSLAQSNTNE